MTRTRFDLFGKDMVSTALETCGPIVTDAEVPADPSLKFIDQLEYTVEDDQLHPTAKDAPDPWDFPIVKPG
jgi:hypothetical protein